MGALYSAVSGARSKLFSNIDWPLFIAALAISLLGLITMRSLSDDNGYFDRQLFWIAISVGAFFISSTIDFSFLKRTSVVVSIFVFALLILALVYVLGTVVKGAQSRFDVGFFAIQPADPAKLVLIVVLAKYFARRHIEIAHIRHIIVSGIYAFLICALVFFQPDFGSAIIIASIWFGMVLVAGISWKHLATLFLVGAIAAGGMWTYAFADYQKQRILTFLHPLADIRGAGYNAYQATVAIGSGETTGKGIGYGTQSKLQFLPEFETDFIFAAYAEEWGFIGVIILFGLFGILIFRILAISRRGSGNFETLFGVGVAVLFVSHFIVHVGMNMGVLPVTGTTIPFMSYGGSHLLTEFVALGVIMAMSRYARPSPARGEATEFIGPV